MTGHPGDYEEIEHTADWAFRVRGRDLAELFSNAARAICTAEHGDVTQESTITRDLHVEGVDRETLLVNWLNELLYLGQSKREAYQKFQITEIDDTHLRAQIYGAPDQGRQRHIKAVTFHNLDIKPTAHGWEATLVVDV